MKKIILLSVYSFFCLLSFGQNAKIDSLMDVLKTAKEDTIVVNTLNELAREFKEIDPDTATYFAIKAMTYARNINYKMGIADAYLWMGLALMNLGKYEEALKSSNNALKTYDDLLNLLELGDRSKFLKQKAKVYNSLGLIYWNQGNYPQGLKNHFAALKLRQEIGDRPGLATTYNNIGLIYKDQGNYPEALKYQFYALKIQEESGYKIGMAKSYGSIGNIYYSIGNFPEALKNHNASLKIYKEKGEKSSYAISYHNIGNVFYAQSNYPEALKKYFEAIKIYKEIGDDRSMGFSYNNIGDVFMVQSNYSEALKQYFQALKIFEEIGHKNGIATEFVNIGKIYLKQNKNDEAAQFLKNGLSFAKSLGIMEVIMGCYADLAELDSAKGNHREAFENYKMYIIYRDSISNKENSKKIVQTQMQYDFDKKEAATKAETDKKDAIAKAEIGKQKVIRNSIAGGTGILVLSSIFIFMVYKRKREATFKNEVSEVEMKALRSQMNPHFIFNSLNSIKRYMANHNNKTAEDYLTKFASVMRMILENSEHKEVPLQQDLKALELYMQLESLRMKKKFNYEIKVDESIDQENTLIPPLILQPFVENSIWHGLAGKEGEGKISISINRVGEMIECIVEDNGVGRERAKINNPEIVSTEKKSLGMKITNARINILNKIKKSKAGVELVDLAEGMRVIVRLPLELSF